MSDSETSGNEPSLKRARTALSESEISEEEEEPIVRRRAPRRVIANDDDEEDGDDGDDAGDDDDGDEDGEPDVKDEPDDDDDEGYTEKPKSAATTTTTTTSTQRHTAKKEEPESSDGDVKEEEEEDEDDDMKDEGEEDEDDFDFEREVKKETKGTKRKRSSSSSTTTAASPKAKRSTSSTRRSSTSTTSKKRTTAASGKKGSKDPKEEKGKGKGKSKVKDEPEEEWEWWNDEKLPKGVKWRTLVHQGVLFPPDYEPHGVKMLYDGKPITLPPEVEEIATYYAQYLETDHVKKPVFNENFFEGFRGMLEGTPLHKQITDFDLCDFTPINRFLVQRKEAKAARSKEEKDQEKAEKEKIQAKYGFAMVDGHKQKVGNYRVEPPGLFLGRGDHPKTGNIKKRIMPEDITINIGEGAKVPPCPIAGHAWGSIVHNNKVTWLAFWKENINGNFKYVWLSASSAIKGQADMKKFEVSRKLKKRIAKIRKNYDKEMKSREKKIRQRATALWVIDHLALRVGNEKGKDEADTVGCCSLRVEHVKLTEPNTLEFDFLGKDSMRYHNSVQVPDLVFKNFKLFMKGKKPSDDLFDHLTTTALNAHLKAQMPGLTAKVFRTYNASITLQQELAKDMGGAESVNEKFLFYNRANKEVAILCNHQRSTPKTHDAQMEKLDALIEDLEDEKKELKRRLAAAKAGKPMPTPRKKKKRVPPTPTKKRGAKEGEADTEPEAPKEKTLPSDPERIKKAIAKLDARLLAKRTEKINKDELKTVALGTAKINYMDPRITVAWCKRSGVPIEKIFAKTLRDKFPWAMSVDEDYEY
eukprot:TRINITY_DN6711_c0_g1_i1.p1 TRINITY_DN6711_c0_g1~~TRINITY_DN6711_c0_g1_i1.p1  ORF type:complete len:825 (+),score=255.43 TRINITY_DN6711_c0_g1_i1:41-2476(+)